MDKRSHQRKFTKAQLKAVSAVENDLDELSNKPYRLFHSLEKMAIAFLSEDEEHLKQVLADLLEAQDSYYKFKNIPSMLVDSADICRDVKKELKAGVPDDWTEDEVYRYGQGVDEAVKRIALKFNEKLINEIF